MKMLIAVLSEKSNKHFVKCPYNYININTKHRLNENTSTLPTSPLTVFSLVT